jgi:hypothetical protein
MGEENEQGVEPEATRTPNKDTGGTRGGGEHHCAPAGGHNRDESNSTVAPTSQAGITNQLTHGRRHQRRSPTAEES